MNDFYKTNQIQPRSQGPIGMSSSQVLAFSFELSEPQFPYLEIGDKNTIHLLEGFFFFFLDYAREVM